MHRIPTAFLLAMLTSATFAAQLGSPKPAPLVGARSLALSPDGKRLAFTYQGDIWVAPADGGRAVPVTNHVEMDDNALWSPDGEWIAFSSNRSGNNDIYVVPADGGTTRRLTWNSGSDVPSDWTPDGKAIAFVGRRDDQTNCLYTVDVATTQTHQLLADMMPIGSPRFALDGKRLLYTRFGFPWVRPCYQGSAASQLWEVDLANGKRSKIADTGFQHLWPGFALGGKTVLMVTVSEKTPSSSYLNKPIPKNVDNASRTPNVYALDAPGKERRVTDFVGEGPRFLTVARKADVAAFECDGDVYVMQLGQKPKKIDLVATIDDKTTQEERLILTNGVSDMALSPKGDKLAFTVRGEIWLVPTKKGKGPNADDATQLTDWAGFDERPIWAPDNKFIFFVSDRDGAYRLYRMDTDSKAVSPVTKQNADVIQLRLTPDKMFLSYWLTGKDGGLFKVPVTGGEPVRLVSRRLPALSDSNADMGYDWSPDGRYVAFSDVLKRSGYYYWDSTTDIFILDTQDGKTYNVTKLSASHSTPRFTPDGRYLLFSSNRSGPGIYALPLKAEDARPTELELKFEKPTAPVKVEIDFTDIDLRPRRIISQPLSGNLQIDPNTGDIFFLSEGDLWKATYSGDGATRITSGGGIGDFDFSDDLNQIAFLKSGAMNIMEFRKPNNPVTGVAFRADWTHDLRAEHRAAFDEFWRDYNRGFYDTNFHGRDWEAIKPHYEKLLPSVGHRNEMATVLNMMVGELESSHSEVGPAQGNPNGQTSAHPGFSIDYSYEGPGLRIKEVPAHTPGSYAKTKLNPGEIVTKINGKDVRADEALWRDVLNEQVGRELTFTVKGLDGKERQVKYRAMSSGEYSAIVWDNRIQARRKYVEEKSGGKLTYVHIAGMGGGELDRFNQQIWEYASGKEGVIIDVRNNGGGNTSDRIIDVLERQPNSYYQDRDQDPILGPGQALAMPMVVMAAETSYSNAEMFPYAMRARKLATLVGMPTPGYVIYTGGMRLVDGTMARMPGTGVYRLDGSPLEDMGQQPDYKVDITPEQYFSGQDPQLDKAIEVLMKQVGKGR